MRPRRNPSPAKLVSVAEYLGYRPSVPPVREPPPSTATDLLAMMEVDLEPGELDGLRIEQFTVPDYGESDDHRGAAEMLRAALDGREIPPGTYTRLVDRRGGRRPPIMSDTPAERLDHMEAVGKMADPSCRRILINGLGLGMVLSAALRLGHAGHIDVVENDPRVIRLVGSQYAARAERAGIGLRIIERDAMTQAARWPAGTRWDVGWTDIWPSLCSGNLSEVFAFRMSYGTRCGWHDCWGRGILLDLRRRGL
jgi:hypothetical protein